MCSSIDRWITGVLNNTLILLFPSFLIFSATDIHYCIPTVQPWPIMLFPKTCISVSYLQNGENNAFMLLQIHFEIKQQCYISACYYSIFMQLHLQSRVPEKKPNIWFFPVPDLQTPKLILLSLGFLD